MTAMFIACLLGLLLPFYCAAALYLVFLLIAAASCRHRLADLSPNALTSDVNDPSWAMQMAQGERVRFLVLIPAHNEELVLSSTCEAVQRLDYPKDLLQVVVIADNCSDRTAQIARKFEFLAFERRDMVNIGKGFALEWALDRLQDSVEHVPGDGTDKEFLQNSDHAALVQPFDAVVVIDADTVPAPNLLAEFAKRLRMGDAVLQARYEVLNVNETWRTQLMSCALALVHIVKPLGRERLGLSDGLKGNGMCLARSVVQHIPWSGASITEDIEYTVRLCLAGYRVGFVPETAVWAQMPVTARQSESQRKRWEGGRYRLLRETSPGLLLAGIRRGRWLLVDRALDLIIPPFAEMVVVPLAAAILCACVLALTHYRPVAVLGVVWVSVLFIQAVYMIGGLWLARVPLSVAAAVMYAPGYIVWKLGIYGSMLLRRSPQVWKRTQRHKLPDP